MGGGAGRVERPGGGVGHRRCFAGHPCGVPRPPHPGVPLPARGTPLPPARTRFPRPPDRYRVAWAALGIGGGHSD
eukprot:8438424-Alexandrium_andersonii.AAC.1